MRARLGVIVAAALVAPSIAGCAGRSSGAALNGNSTPLATSPAASSPAVGSASAAPASATSASGVPSARSPLPDGVYRSRVGYALATSSGADPGDGDTGTWTLTVKAGTYRLACAPISDPGSDCGNDGSDSLETVELGTLRGSGSTVWFVHDQAALSKVNGCVVGSQADNGCGPDGGYHMHWALRGRLLTFSDLVGLGDEAGGSPINNYTIQPWTRIS